MAEGSKQGFEIPPEMRKLAEQSVDEAKKAFDGFMSAAQKAVDRFQGEAAVAQTGVRNMQSKAVGFAERNIESSFEFARSLARSKSAEEMMRLQAEYVESQIRVLGEQAKELQQNAAKTGAREAKSS